MSTGQDEGGGDASTNRRRRRRSSEEIVSITLSSPVEIFENRHISPALERRRENGSLRQLTTYFGKKSNTSASSRSAIIDFSSNDYLGLAQSVQQQQIVDDVYQKLPTRLLGSTGSRLLTGASEYALNLESRLAKLHKRQSALLCNSGYDANLSVMSCFSLNSTIIMDELCHNSIQMGTRLSRGCTLRKFRHSNLQDLKRILLLAEEQQNILGSTSTSMSMSMSISTNKKPTIIVVESIYSMDGDSAPLKEILDMALAHNACVIVDEAHGLGVLGENGLGLLEEYGLENHPSLLCSVHTFGKAAGCHGAVICGSLRVKEFLYNYAYPIIYSTSLPLHSLVCINCSYESMTSTNGKKLRRKVNDLVKLFRKLFFQHILNQFDHNLIGSSQPPPISLVPSESPIHALIIPGNTRCVMFCNTLYIKSKKSIRLYPIRSPTVPKGQERVRIVLHSHNTEDQVIYLINLIKSTLFEMGIIIDETSENGINHDNVDVLSRL
jgi:8-amino-7-oxononanoate synthase